MPFIKVTVNLSGQESVGKSPDSLQTDILVILSGCKKSFFSLFLRAFFINLAQTGAATTPPVILLPKGFLSSFPI